MSRATLGFSAIHTIISGALCSSATLPGSQLARLPFRGMAQYRIFYVLTSFLLIMQLFRLTKNITGKDEIFQLFIGRIHDFLVAASPLCSSFTDEGDVLAYAHHRIHVMRIDDGGYLVLVRDAGNEFINHDACLRVKS